MSQPISNDPIGSGVSSLSEASEVSYSSALDEWLAPSEQLDSTTPRPATASSDIDFLSSRDIPSGLEDQLVNDSLIKVDDGILPIRSIEQTLYKTRAQLLSTKNQFAPVNKLPPEIFDEIFTMATTKCVRSWYTEASTCVCLPDTISSVCSYWRKLALNTSSLWTHIDFFEGSNLYQFRRRSAILLERSRGAPIHLHIFDPVNHDYTPNHNRMSGLLQSLAPYMSCAHFLDIDLRYSLSLASVYGTWLGEGVIGSTKGLSIRRSLRKPLLRPGIELWKNSAEFLLPLRTLHLENIAIDWKSSAYHGLVDLRLNFPGHRRNEVSQSRFAEILASSPQLHILKLSNVHIVRRLPYCEIASTRLDYLRVLTIEIDTESLCLLLPLITPPEHAKSLSVAITLYSATDFPEALETFFRRSHITTLYLAQRSPTLSDSLQIVPLLSVLPSLEHLFIKDWPILRLAWSSTFSNSVFENSRMQSYRVQDSNSLVSVHGIQDIHLIGCSLYNGTSPMLLDTFRDRLFQAIPDMNCIVSSDGPTDIWPCDTEFMFDD
ncbi:hypothetical protein BDV93DRAFT_366866 [Ceratobasidium sp. AG-I]|nr:hypothetical protein BDV93DRAFT_366866 [Ceratobasidium sp. AG-I]